MTHTQKDGKIDIGNNPKVGTKRYFKIFKVFMFL